MQSSDEVAEWLKACGVGGQVVDAFNLRCLVHTATYTDGYLADDAWARCIVPSAAGVELLQALGRNGFPRADLHLALFGLFWHRAILIDVAASDLHAIRATIESEAAAKRIFWPLTQGRLLYDAAQSLFSQMEDTLSPTQTAALLAGKPQGVYQAGNLVTGPFGILNSQGRRSFVPQQTLGLWHCPLLDCRQLHPARLAPPDIPLVESYAKIERAAALRWGSAARWRLAIEAYPEHTVESWRVHSEMPLFLGDCIVGSDRTSVTSAALRTVYAPSLRALLSACGRDASGSPESVASKLTPEEQLQLLLALTDKALIEIVDQLVHEGRIEIPPDEVRRIDTSKSHMLGFRRAPLCELSSSGLRVRRHHPYLFFRHVVLEAYSANDGLADLDWRINAAPGASTEEAFATYLEAVEPATAIENLVLTSPRVTRFVGDAIGTEVTRRDAQARTVLAWKLGLDTPRVDPRIDLIRKAVESFRATAASIGAVGSDIARQALRSSAVNVFVELEGILHNLTSFVVWTLASDHLKDTRFVYSRAEAAASVAGVLGTELGVGAESVSWNASGNTLGTALRYLQELERWVVGLRNANRDAFVRPAGESLPDRSNAVRTTPFRHVQLWADAHPKGLQDFAQRLKTCIDVINRADVATVRNGLEHYREAQRFPATDKILAAAEGVRGFVERVLQERLLPRLYWLQRSESTAYDQTLHVLSDADGTRLTVATPQAIRTPGMNVVATGPMLIAAGNLFWRPNAHLVFRVRPQSVHASYWSNYPARTKAIIEMDQTGEDAEAGGRLQV